jgi:hypothetical protein
MRAAFRVTFESLEDVPSDLDVLAVLVREFGPDVRVTVEQVPQQRHVMPVGSARRENRA